MGGGLVNSIPPASARRFGTAETASGPTQVIRVPQYLNATVAAGLTAKTWDGPTVTVGTDGDGPTGGVLVFDVSGTLTLASQTISVNGLGFRGGGGRVLTGDTGTSTGFSDFSTKGEWLEGRGYRWNSPLLVECDRRRSRRQHGRRLSGGQLRSGSARERGRRWYRRRSRSEREQLGRRRWWELRHRWTWRERVRRTQDLSPAAGAARDPHQRVPRMFLGGGGGAGSSNNGSQNGGPDPGDGRYSSGGAGGGIILVRAYTMSGDGHVHCQRSQCAIRRRSRWRRWGRRRGDDRSHLRFADSASITATANGGNGGDAWPSSSPRASWCAMGPAAVEAAALFGRRTPSGRPPSPAAQTESQQLRMTTTVPQTAASAARTKPTSSRPFQASVRAVNA